MKKCEVKHCNNETSNKYCVKHYQQKKKYGKILNRTIKDKNEIILYDDYAEIILYNVKCVEIARAIIDLEDVDRCKTFKWGLKDNGYVASNNNTLHRFLLNVGKNYIVDHEDKNKLNNQKYNLRVCTHQENSFNVPLLSTNKSGVSGVIFDKSKNKWRAYITKDNKQKFLGYFEKENFDCAVKARLKAELEYFGEFSPQKHLCSKYGIEVG